LHPRPHLADLKIVTSNLAGPAAKGRHPAIGEGINLSKRLVMTE
jgi:hypothetical protein